MASWQIELRVRLATQPVFDDERCGRAEGGVR